MGTENEKGLFPDFILRKNHGEWFLVDFRNPEEGYRRPLKLNESAAEIYIRLNRGDKPMGIAMDIAAANEISADMVLGDIEEFIETLTAFGVPVK